jgi:hypothetical protein
MNIGGSGHKDAAQAYATRILATECIPVQSASLGSPMANCKAQHHVHEAPSAHRLLFSTGHAVEFTDLNVLLASMD